ncbi:hypothetical protein LJK88_06150 [Paenibacillus sp. P26]|nr:hypothetical protein LJK88_06150 [Paenibacillus sp. P26]UUZ90403.1 hypothetical protein LJK87_31405 [Paenibacillus sp. P25]
MNLLPETSAALKWDEPLTRREMLYIAYNAVQRGEGAAPTEERLIEWARAESLLNGNGSGELHLEQTATRAQTVVFLERLDKAVHRLS